MQIALPIVLIFVVLAVLVVGAVVGSTRMHRDRVAEVEEAPQETLEYVVPEGQDAAMLYAALRTKGFSSSTLESYPPRLVISCHQGRDRDREQVRAIIAAAPIDPSGARVEGPPVRFSDED